VVWTFYLESGISRFCHSGGDFARLQFREPQSVQNLGQLGIVALRNEPVSMTAYRVEGMATDGFMPDRLFGDALRRAQQHAGAGGRFQGFRQPGAIPDDLSPHDIGIAGAARRPGRSAADGQAGFRGAPGSAAEFAVRARRWLDERHGYSLRWTCPRRP